ncbi:MAG: DUF1428 domain-containing protein [Emcibacteraceae bacterium]
MTYVDGFVLAVKKDRLDDYKKMAEIAGKIWQEHGAISYRECIGEDMEDKGFCLTFPAAFNVPEDEIAVFSYIEYKSREHRDAVNEKVHNDPRLAESCDLDNMPFDCKRMAYGGFKTIVEF